MKRLLFCLLVPFCLRAEFQLQGDHWRATIDDGGRLLSYVLGDAELLAPFVDDAAMLIIEGRTPIEFATVTEDGGDLVFGGEWLELRYRATPAALVMSWTSRTLARLELRWRFSEAVTGAYDGEDDTFVDPHDTWYNDMVDGRLTTADGAVLVIGHHGYWTREPYTAEGVGCFGASIYPRNAGECRFVAEPTPSPATALVFEVKGENPDFLPPGGHPARFPCTARNLGTQPLAFAWRATVRRFPEQTEVLKATGEALMSPAGDAVVPVELPVQEPGVYQAQLELVQGDTVLREKLWNFCYDFGNWRPVCPKPDDFGAFWERTLTELAAVPVDLRKTEIERDDKSTLYKVNYAVLNGERTSAWLRIPRGEGPFPARLELPSSGVNVLPPPRDQGAVEMKIAIHGFDVDKSDFPAQPPYPWPNARYHPVGLASPETYFYRNVYARCWRAVDILLAMPEVQRDRIMVSGGSQGGGLAVVTAAFRPEVGLCSPGFPGLCRLDWTVRDGIGSWPLSRDDIPEGRSLDNMLHTLSYFDVANFIGRVECPIVATIGWMDTVTAAPGQVAAFAQADRERFTLHCAPWGRHGASARTQRLWFGTQREFLQGKELSLPKTWTGDKVR